MSKHFDILAYLMGKAAGGGGGDVTVESKSIAANGTYTAPTGKAYSPVVVSVPNSYAAGDEGKVVSNGALVAQTAHAEVNSNGTIDTTLNNSVVVNVSGGGGSNWTLLASAEFEVNTTSSTATDVGSVELPDNNFGAEDIIWVHIRDKAGKREGYWYGSDTAIINVALANGSRTDISTFGKFIIYVQANDSYAGAVNSYGVNAQKLTQRSDDHKVYIQARYNSSYGTIDGTYKVDVYKLTPASGMTMFDTGS